MREDSRDYKRAIDWLGARSLVFQFTSIFALVTLIIMIVAGFVLSLYLVGAVRETPAIPKPRDTQSEWLVWL